MPYIILLVILFSLPSLSFGEKIPYPKGGLKKNDLFIKNWNPVTGLSAYIKYGDSKVKSLPYFNFDLNLSYLRFFIKSDAEWDKAYKEYLFSPWFTYIIEVKPFDFASFLTSGSKYSIFVEQNEWLSNLTFIVSNKNFASTQFIIPPLQWYFDLLNSSIEINKIITPNQNATYNSIIEIWYPKTKDIGFGIADRIHIFQNPYHALGIMAYFEFSISTKDKQAKGTDSDTLENFNTKRFTFAGLFGLFYKLKLDDIELESNIIYHILKGNFDDWILDVIEHTLVFYTEIVFIDMILLHLNYHFIYANYGEFKEVIQSHTLNLGAEIRGFGDKVEWLGLGFDLFYQNTDQNIPANYAWFTNYNEYDAKLKSIGLVFSVNFFPLSFHDKNHRLKLGFLFGLFYNIWERQGEGIFDSSSVNESAKSWSKGFMFKIDYKF